MIEGSSVDKCYQHRLHVRTVSFDEVQIDALILTVELAGGGLDCQRRKCQTIRNDHYDGVERLRTLQDGTCSLCFSTTSGTASWATLYFLYLETTCTCISCVENRYTVLQIAEADSHVYLMVVMSSIQKESESTLVVGFI